ncbi:unnamed protein product [Closterium sp. NIES-65]|nr:unnamed protein product [Closterium sp. NIES-65]
MLRYSEFPLLPWGSTGDGVPGQRQQWLVTAEGEGESGSYQLNESSILLSARITTSAPITPLCAPRISQESLKSAEVWGEGGHVGRVSRLQEYSQLAPLLLSHLTPLCSADLPIKSAEGGRHGGRVSQGKETLKSAEGGVRGTCAQCREQLKELQEWFAGVEASKLGDADSEGQQEEGGRGRGGSTTDVSPIIPPSLMSTNPHPHSFPPLLALAVEASKLGDQGSEGQQGGGGSTDVSPIFPAPLTLIRPSFPPLLGLALGRWVEASKLGDAGSEGQPGGGGGRGRGGGGRGGAGGRSTEADDVMELQSRLGKTGTEEGHRGRGDVMELQSRLLEKQGELKQLKAEYEALQVGLWGSARKVTGEGGREGRDTEAGDVMVLQSRLVEKQGELKRLKAEYESLHCRGTEANDVMELQIRLVEKQGELKQLKAEYEALQVRVGGSVRPVFRGVKVNADKAALDVKERSEGECGQGSAGLDVKRSESTFEAPQNDFRKRHEKKRHQKVNADKAALDVKLTESCLMCLSFHPSVFLPTLSHLSQHQKRHQKVNADKAALDVKLTESCLMCLSFHPSVFLPTLSHLSQHQKRHQKVNADKAALDVKLTESGADWGKKAITKEVTFESTQKSPRVVSGFRLKSQLLPSPYNPLFLSPFPLFPTKLTFESTQNRLKSQLLPSPYNPLFLSPFPLFPTKLTFESTQNRLKSQLLPSPYNPLFLSPFPLFPTKLTFESTQNRLKSQLLPSPYNPLFLSPFPLFPTKLTFESTQNRLKSQLLPSPYNPLFLSPFPLFPTKLTFESTQNRLKSQLLPSPYNPLFLSPFPLFPTKLTFESTQNRLKSQLLPSPYNPLFLSPFPLFPTKLNFESTQKSTPSIPTQPSLLIPFPPLPHHSPPITSTLPLVAEQGAEQGNGAAAELQVTCPHSLSSHQGNGAAAQLQAPDRPSLVKTYRSLLPPLSRPAALFSQSALQDASVRWNNHAISSFAVSPSSLPPSLPPHLHLPYCSALQDSSVRWNNHALSSFASLNALSPSALASATAGTGDACRHRFCLTPLSRPASLFAQSALQDSSVRWNNHAFSSFASLNALSPSALATATAGTGDACGRQPGGGGCWNMSAEERRWMVKPPKNTAAGGALTVKEVIAIKKGALRIGLDFNGGSGSFAAHMARHNVTMMTSAMNLEANVGRKKGLPFLETIALRGLVPIWLPYKVRLPFYDNTLDILHATNAIKFMPSPAEFEEVLFEWDRVLRVGGVMWFEEFTASAAEMPSYLSVLDLLKYRHLHWSVTPPKAMIGKPAGTVILHCLLEKPMRKDL